MLSLDFYLIFFLTIGSMCGISRPNYYVQTNRSMRPKFNESDPCNTSPLLSVLQRELCLNRSIIRQAFMTGGQEAQNLTTKMFKSDDWKFGSFDTMSPYTVWVDRPTMESAFLTSLRAAMYTIHYWNVCIQNETLCNCSTNGQKLRENGRRYKFIWQDCSNGMDEGAKAASSWMKLDSYMTSRISLTSIAEHNIRVGLQVVRSLITTVYTCLNMTYDDRFCRKGHVVNVVPQPMDVAVKLFQKYEHAVPIHFSRLGNVRFVDGVDVRKTLIYSERSYS